MKYGLMVVLALAAAGLTALSCDSGGTTGCTDGAVLACTTAGGVAGQQTCVGGAWTACTVTTVCTDGESAQCTTACSTAGVKICSEGAWGACMAMAQEACDGADNDCDQQVDEEMAAVACNCGAAVGTKACVGGAFTPCTAGSPTNPELCDNLDNNCNGQVDEGVTKPCETDCGDGVQTCYYGAWGDCDADEPADEICDGKDNDCNGQTDDGLGELSCGLGECAHTEPACVGGNPGACDPMEGKTAETCDQLDNDCDGEVDEGAADCCEAGQMAECSSNTGECEKGTWTCQPDGTWGPCSGVLPTDELCDGLDNDCVSGVDNGNPEGGAACGTDKGECEKGIETCVGGDLVCQGEKAPKDEVCDGKDNDCNEKIDDGLDEDAYEDNQSCNNGYELPDLQEEAEEPMEFAGTLYTTTAGATDEDWYKIHFTEASDWLPPCGFSLDDVCYALDFELVDAVEQTLCVKIGDCQNPDFEGCADADDFLLIGWPGGWGVNDDQDIYIQIKGAQSCQEYKVTLTPYSVCPNEGLCPWDEGYVPPEG
ncbi:MAG: hypothetical protein FJ098_07030 [Deltaproteobacteria bacterium]|nr:hypothetical protein [Deltaproteobacteria bacterium]